MAEIEVEGEICQSRLPSRKAVKTRRRKLVDTLKHPQQKQMGVAFSVRALGHPETKQGCIFPFYLVRMGGS